MDIRADFLGVQVTISDPSQSPMPLVYLKAPPVADSSGAISFRASKGQLRMLAEAFALAAEVTA